MGKLQTDTFTVGWIEVKNLLRYLKSIIQLGIYIRLHAHIKWIYEYRDADLAREEF